MRKGTESSPGIQKERSINGLIAVCVGIGAVTALAIVTIVLLGSESKQSVVAVTSSALGIISAMVGAYLGIKISAESHAKASQEAKNAAVASHEREAAQQKSRGMAEKLDELTHQGLSSKTAEAIKEAGAEAEEEARTVGPPPGGAAW